MSSSTSMRVFTCYNKERQLIDVENTDTVAAVKLRVQDVFQIDTNDRGEKKFVVLTYQGSELENEWVLQDVGINVGATLRVSLRAEIKPKLHVHVAFNDETIDILEEIDFELTTVAILKCMITRKIGIPVTVFRLLTHDGQEMYDANTLEQYDIKFGNTVRMKTWDGWNELLKSSILGMARHALHHLSHDDAVAKFQLRTMLFIAAHYGHIDLATTVLKQGIRPDEAIGDHPSKEWCVSPHIEASKTPVHEAAEHGKISILRIFVHFNICCVTCKDGAGLTGLNIALRKQQREVALYLLTKQWSNVQFSAVTLPLTIYSQVRKWCDRAKDRVLLVYEPSKSSTRYKKTTNQPGALCGQGVIIDGFSKSSMNSKKLKNVAFNDCASTRLASAGLPRMCGVRTPALVNKYRLKIQQKKYGLDSDEEFEDDDLPELSDARPRSKGVFESRPVLPQIKSSVQGPFASRTKGASAVSRGRFLKSGADSAVDYSHDSERRKSTKSTYIRTMGGTKSHAGPSRPMSFAAPSTTMYGYGDLNFMVERREKERTKRKRAASMDSVIPLPSTSIDINPTRPFFHKIKEEENLPRLTLDLYEHLTGRTTWEQAIESLTIASTFKEKPWLSQVRMAMSLFKAHVKNAGKKKSIASNLNSLKTPGRVASPRKETHGMRRQQMPPVSAS